jgi:hypothetical protein
MVMISPRPLIFLRFLWLPWSLPLGRFPTGHAVNPSLSEFYVQMRVVRHYNGQTGLQI